MLNPGQFQKLILAVTITAQMCLPAAYCQEATGGSNPTPASSPTPLELDFSSTDKTMSGSKITAPVNIQVGQSTVQVTNSSVLTPGEYAAAMQVLHTGQQSVILGDLGNAVGGQLNLTRVQSPIANLVIPQGVTAVNNFGLTNGALSISGNLTNAGTLYAVSTVSQITNANIFANNISNLQGGLITSVLPQGGIAGITGAISSLNLSLNAVNNIVNAGTISSAGSLSAIAGNSIINSSQGAVMQAMQNVNLQALNVFNAGSIIAQAGALNVATATLTNQSLMQSVLGNVNIQSPGNALNVDNALGTISALNELSFKTAPSVLDSLGNVTDAASLSLTGGALSGSDISFETEGGHIALVADQVNGPVSLSAASAVAGSLHSDFTLGRVNLTEDPLYFAAGNLELGSGGSGLFGAGGNTVSSTTNRNFAALAWGNILATGAVAGAGINSGTASITMASGVNYTIINPGCLSCVQGTDYTIGAVTASGGNIQLTNVALISTSATGIINLQAHSGSTNAGSVTTAAITTTGTDNTFTLNPGGNAGAITITANSNISTNAINSTGGGGGSNSFSVGQVGGTAGIISVTTTAGNIAIGGLVASVGGKGGTSTTANGAAGGAGRAMTISTGSGDINITGAVSSTGGAGGTSTGATGGLGGAAGAMSISTSSGNITLGGAVSSAGGVGGTSSATAGSGGAASTISITSTGTTSITGLVSSAGGAKGCCSGGAVGASSNTTLTANLLTLLTAGTSLNVGTGRVFITTTGILAAASLYDADGNYATGTAHVTAIVGGVGFRVGSAVAGNYSAGNISASGANSNINGVILTGTPNIAVGTYGGGPFTISITENGIPKTITNGNLITPAEQIAVVQKTAGTQTIVLNASGNATGGTFAWNTANIPGGNFTVLTLPSTVVGTSNVNNLIFSGVVTVNGTVNFTPAAASLSGSNITVGATGTVSGATGTTLTLTSATAVGNFTTVSSGGNITAPTVNINTPTLNNSGAITASNGNLSIQSNLAGNALALNLAAGSLLTSTGGAGNVLFNSTTLGNITASGATGDISAISSVSFNGGAVNVSVNQITGTIIGNGNPYNVTAAAGSLSLGAVTLTGAGGFTSANNITLSGALSSTSTVGLTTGTSGTLTIQGAGSVQGTAVTLTTPTLVNNNGGIVTATNGDLTVNSNAVGQVLGLTLAGGSTLRTTGGTGIVRFNAAAAGAISTTVSSGTVTGLNGVNLNGGTGAVNVTLDSLSGTVSANGTSVSLTELTAGTPLTVQSISSTAGNVSLTNSGAASSIVVAAGGTVTSVGGTTTLTTPTLSNGGTITSRTAGGNGGTVNITNAGALNISTLGNINASPLATGSAGTVTINPTGTLTIQSGTINNSGSGVGANNGGTVTISGTSLTVAGGALTVNANGSDTGNGGAISITATGAASDIAVGAAVGNFALSATSGIGATGNGGSVTLSAGRTLTANAASLAVGPLSTNGNGGNIALTVATAAAGNLQVTGSINGSGIGTGNGGIISLNYNSANPFIVGAAVANSGVTGNISANAPGSGTGGAITIANANASALNITLTGNITAGSGSGTVGALTLSKAGQVVSVTGAGTLAGAITASGSSVTINPAAASTVLTVQAISSTAGAVALTANGANSSIVVNSGGTIAAVGGTTTLSTFALSNGGTISSRAAAGLAGTITLTSTGALAITTLGTINVNPAVSGVGGTVNINSVGALTIGTGTISANGFGAGNFNGGSITIQGTSATVTGGGALTLNTNGVGTGSGGTISLTATGAAGGLSIGSAAGNFAISATSGNGASGNGGTVSVSAGAGLTVTAASLTVNTLSTNGNGGNLTLVAGTAAAGNLAITGVLSANGVGTGNGGTISVTSNSVTVFALDGGAVANGVNGLSANKGVGGTNDGSITMRNNGGDVTVSLPLAANNITLQTGAVGNGNINIYSNVTGTTSVNITAGGAGNVLVYRATPVVTSTGANAPGALVFNAGGTVAYSVDAANGNLLIINPATNAVTGTIAIGANPAYLAVDSANNRAYVTSTGSNIVSVVNLASNTVIGTITLSARANGIVVSPDGTKIFVATGEDKVTVVTTSNFSTYVPGAPIVVDVSGVGVGTQNLTLDSTGAYLYIGNQTSQRISIMNVATNAIIAGTGGTTGALLVGSRPLGMAANGGFIYVTNYLSHDVYTINTATQSVSSQNGITGISVGATSTPVSIAVSANGLTAYSANQTTNTVSVINLATYATVDTISLASAPSAITMSPDGNFMYVASASGSSLTKITLQPLVTGGTINMTSSSGNIGSLAAPIRTVATTMSVNSGGNAYIEQAGNVSVGASTVAGSFQLASSGTVTNTGLITAGSLNWTTNNKDIMLGASFNVTSAAAIYAVGSGNINWTAGMLTAGSINLFSSYGNIGTFANQIRTTTPILRANTSGAGNVFINNTGNVTLLDSTAGGSFSLTNSVGTTITVAGRVEVPNTIGHNITLQTTGNNAANRINVQAKVLAGGTVTLTATGGTISYLPQTGVSTQLSATVAAVPNASAIALNAAGTFAYVTDSVNWPPTSGNVRVIDTATNLVVATIAVGNNPEGVAVSPDGNYLFVTNRFSDSISVIDLRVGATFRQVVATIALPAGSEPWGIAFNPAGASNQAYVTNAGTSTVSVLNWQTNTVTATITGLPVGVFASYPKGIAFNPTGTAAYVADQFNRAVTVIDTGTNAITTHISVGDGPFGIATGNVGATPFAYVTNISDNTVSVINLTTNTLVSTINVGNNPLGVSLSPTGTFAYVVNLGSNSVSVINTSTNVVVATVPVGSLPKGMGNFVGDVGGNVRAYVANGSGTVSVLDPTPALVDPYLVVLNGANVGTALDPVGILTQHLEINATGDVYAKISGSTIIDTSNVGGVLHLTSDGNITTAGDINAGSVSLQTPFSLLVGNITSTSGSILLNGNSVDVSNLSQVTANGGGVYVQSANGPISVINSTMSYTGGVLQSLVVFGTPAGTASGAQASLPALATGALPTSFASSAQLWVGTGEPLMTASALSALDVTSSTSRGYSSTSTTATSITGGTALQSAAPSDETESTLGPIQALSGGIVRSLNMLGGDASSESTISHGLRSTAIRADESTLSAIVKDAGADYTVSDQVMHLNKGDVLVSCLKGLTIQSGKHTVQLSKGAVALVRVIGDRLYVANLFDRKDGSVSLRLNSGRLLTVTLGEEVVVGASAEDMSAVIDDGMARRSVRAIDVQNTSLISSQISYASVLQKSPLLQLVHFDDDSISRSISTKVEKAAACLLQLTAARGPYKTGAQH